MSDKNMIELAEIRNGYDLNKYGNLTLEQNSLIKYDNLCLNLIKENQELKKQLEKKYNKTGTLTNEVLYEEKTKLINQQKEFIEYLESMLDNDRDIFSVVRVKDVLSKYKEIIGGKE